MSDDVFQDRDGVRHRITEWLGLRDDQTTEYGWCTDCAKWLLINHTDHSVRPV